MTLHHESRIQLNKLRLPLEEDPADWWRERYGIVDMFLNDIAAGALIEVPSDWNADAAEGVADRVAEGLRRLLQELWQRDLARPVVAVFWPGEGAEDGEAVDALRRLTWDQEAHRGDFALREAADRGRAEELLWALLGDTLGALDESARDDKVGLEEVEEALNEARSAPDVTEPEGRLIDLLTEELARAQRAFEPPDLVGALRDWLRAEEATP